VLALELQLPDGHGQRGHFTRWADLRSIKAVAAPLGLFEHAE
jgi:hypothetical protein